MWHHSAIQLFSTFAEIKYHPMWRLLRFNHLHSNWRHPRRGRGNSEGDQSRRSVITSFRRSNRLIQGNRCCTDSIVEKALRETHLINAVFPVSCSEGWSSCRNCGLHWIRGLEFSITVTWIHPKYFNSFPFRDSIGLASGYLHVNWRRTTHDPKSLLARQQKKN